MSQEKSVRRINWNRYADFRSRKTRDNLIDLCSKYSDTHLKNAFKTPDKTGLYPIHWASIHNRSDLIEIMLDKGSPLKEKCRNKLFADGTPLHLAAMNGSIETVTVLLNRCDSVDDWLRERDADGQTALMRCAPPRSKRMDTVRDLLRKNLWSLSGRPAEIALYLIHRGADWRETDSIEGMNLLHLAIINDYDDIVCMLLVIDKKMASTAVQLRRPTDREVNKKKDGELESIDLDENNSSSATSSPSSDNDDTMQSQRSLIDRRTRTKQLIGKNMLPLQLAIIHGRISMINVLWSAQEVEQSPAEADHDWPTTDDKRDEQRLRSIINKVYWTNKHQVIRLVRAGCLKFVLALDLTLITLVWMPVYLDNDEDRAMITIRNGVFVLSYFISMALAFRVMLTKPGYLRRNEPKYFAEMKSLTRVLSRDKTPIEKNPKQRDTNTSDQPNEVKQLANKSIEAKGKSGSEPAPKVKDIAERVRLLCHKCRCIRRARSRHCSYCNHCVQDFDHHCIYLSCCIGRKNRLEFFLLMISITLMAIYGTMIHANSIEYGSWNQGWHFIGFLWIFKYVLIGGLTCLFILKRASHGVTMFEEIRSNRIRKIFGSEGPPESISKSHRYYSTTLRGSFWRYSPNRFLTGDLPTRTIISNLREYANYSSIWNSVTCADTQLARTVTTIISSERNKAYEIP